MNLTETLIPLGVAVPVVLWLGRKIVEATTAVVNLNRDIAALRADLHRVTNDKLDREDFTHWTERLQDRNKTLDIPVIKRYDPAA